MSGAGPQSARLAQTARCQPCSLQAKGVQPVSHFCVG